MVLSMCVRLRIWTRAHSAPFQAVGREEHWEGKSSGVHKVLIKFPGIDL